MIAAFPELRDPTNVWREALPAFDLGVLTSHVALLHNIRTDWSHRIDPPMWSVATEWQIYLLFPILLIARRRFGDWSAVLLAFAVATAIWVASRWLGVIYLRNMCAWLAGVFALGMVAAVAGFSDDPRWQHRETNLPWLSLGLGLVLVAILLVVIFNRRLPADCVMGAATACLLVGCTRDVKSGSSSRRSWVVRIFEARSSVFLGTFSYSFYLMHFPIISLCDGWLRKAHLPEGSHYVWLFALSMPLSLAVSYLFYWFCERPFLSRQQRSMEAVVRAEIAGPAPNRKFLAKNLTSLYLRSRR